MSSFTTERFAAFDRPDWLERRARSAFERYAAAPPPSAQPESWRYSPIADLALDELAPAAPNGEVAIDGLPSVAGAHRVVVRNGVVVDAAVDDGAITVDRRTEVRLLDVPEPDALTYLHDAFVPEVVVVRIAPGKVVERPLLIVTQVTGGGTASFPHVVIEAGEQSEATIVEWLTSGEGAERNYVDPVTELHLGNAANVRYVNAQTLGTRTWHTGHVVAEVGRDASLRAWLLATGAEYGRTYVAATMSGQGSNARIAGVYFGDERQVLDVRSLQDHVGVRSVSDFQLKGAVVDDARGVYTGLIRVREGAKATESFLGNRNLVLSDGAHVDSVPNLEITNENDIRSCGHAAATGPVDEEHLFYLESRGVPTPVAQRLIVSGFFDEVLDTVPVVEARDAIRDEVARKLAKVVAG